MKLPPVLLVCLMLAFQSPVRGCLWDSETLASETKRFPDVSALIAGTFARHSREFHQWRVAKKQTLVNDKKAAALDYDDLAVSQHKLGDHKAAIATMYKKDKLMPGIYETYSNLGTFYIYTGELREALKHIDRALSINANAHFGREKYQKWLVLWILEEKGAVEDEAGFRPDMLRGFAAMVARMEAGGVSKEAGKNLRLEEAQIQAAVRGVTGMMFFADFDNPILLEALGDLLRVGATRQGPSYLASLCYMHAMFKSEDPQAKKRYSKLFENASSSTRRDEAYYKSILQSALNQGEKLNESIRAEEMAWIAEGKDAAVEFQKKYLQPEAKK
ncbi:tetratricopeptide repeat protein [Brevifollis gellanilyticus]|nr:tetratricopeptide repeat protein [Brevifollis gellanilyticus]